MTTVTLRATGSAPVEVAWERYAQPILWKHWSPQIRRVNVDVDRIAPGLTGTVDGYLGLHVSFVVDAVDEAARTWAWTVTTGPVRLRLQHEVTDLGGRGAPGTATTLVVSGPAPVVLGYLAPAQLALHRLVRP